MGFIILISCVCPISNVSIDISARRDQNLVYLFCMLTLVSRIEKMSNLLSGRNNRCLFSKTVNLFTLINFRSVNDLFIVGWMICSKVSCFVLLLIVTLSNCCYIYLYFSRNFNLCCRMVLNLLHTVICVFWHIYYIKKS